jgi:hypothetical protein
MRATAASTTGGPGGLGGHDRPHHPPSIAMVLYPASRGLAGAAAPGRAIPEPMGLFLMLDLFFSPRAPGLRARARLAPGARHGP